jgi:hypothetical protein
MTIQLPQGAVLDNAPSSDSSVIKLPTGAVLDQSTSPVSTQGSNNIPGMDFMKNVATGFAYPIVKTAKGIGDLLGLQPTPFGQGFLQSAEDTSSGTVGKTIGDIGGNVAQFMAPGGAEKSLFLKGAEYIDKLPELLGLGEKAAGILGNSLKVALKAGITGASTAGVTGLQTGGDVGSMETSGLVGGFAGGLGQALESFGKPIAQALNKGDFKLSPMQEAKATQKANSAAQFITDNKILGTDSTKYAKLDTINRDLETALQSSLPTTVNVPKSKIIAIINDRVESLINSDPPAYKTARSEADSAIDILNKSQGTSINGSIDMETTLSGKRSWGNEAFSTAQYAVKDPRVKAEGAFAIEQGYQQALSDTLDSVKGTIKIPPSLSGMFGGATEVSIGDFNKVYSQAISAKSLTYLAQFKNDPGMFSKMFGVWIGQGIGNAILPGPAGSVLGGIGGDIGAKRLPSFIRNMSERALQSNANTTPMLGKIGLGAFMPSNQNQ